jgi:hypothetical protein
VVSALGLACSSCFLGEEERWAYYLTTGLLLLVPALLLGGIFAWLRAAQRDDAGR